MPPVSQGEAVSCGTEIAQLDGDECITLNRSLIEDIEAKISRIFEEKLSLELQQQLEVVRTLISREETGATSDDDFVAPMQLCRAVVAQGGVAPSISAGFASIGKALNVFQRVKGRLVALESAEEPYQSRAPSSRQKASTPSESDLAPVTAAEFGERAVPPCTQSVHEFMELLVGTIQGHECIVLGDGCHRDDALSQILSAPNFPQRLRNEGLTHVVFEHIYPQHVEMIRVDRDAGVRRLEQHLLENTFPVLISAQADAFVPTEEETQRRREVVAFQHRQVRAYLDFILGCCAQPGLCVVAADSPVLYRKQQLDRITGLTAHVTALIEDIYESSLKSAPQAPDSAKMLVIAGAAHTNSKNSAAATRTVAEASGRPIKGIVQRIREKTSECRVRELVVVSSASTGLHAQLASIQNPIYIIKSAMSA